MRSRDREFPVNREDLVRKSYEPEVRAALTDRLAIEARGGEPLAWWSKHNGYRVVDQNEWYALQARLRREALR
jgi:hypothetical protein